MRARKAAFLVAGAVLLLASAARAGGEEDGGFADRDDLLTMPISPGILMVCHGFNCLYRDLIHLTPRDFTEMARLMAPGKASPAAERSALGRLMAWLDRRIGPEIGTANHVARAGVSYFGQRGQFDCVDTTHNAVLTLRELQRLKLLVHHRLAQPASRLDPPHNTAVIVDGSSGESWAVDGWTRGYGEAPDIMPLRVWQVASITSEPRRGAADSRLFPSRAAEPADAVPHDP